jgi:zinc protease
MKKHPASSLIRLTAFIFIAAFLLSSALQAQDNLNQKIPVDPQIRIGKLDNGLTYYIRKNTKPEKRAEMRLAVNAGSVLEDDDQQGLAHFVEHMAFNGTKNFPKNDLVKYLQSVGMQFGPEINAYTSFDETVFMLTLPTDSAHILEKGYQIMEDWAHNLSFDDGEIDKERGVIVEEWRLGRGPFQRMRDKYIPVIFKGSKYAERLPIGKKEIIEGAPHDKIRQFYNDWYRPDLIAFIIVGDIDPDAAEKSIREHFGRLQPKSPERPRPQFKVPDQPGTTAVSASDKEAPYTLVQLLCKNDPRIETRLMDYRESLVIQLVSSMLNQRLDELKEQADPPLLLSMVQYGSLGTREKEAFQMGALVPETGIERGVKTLIRETERVLLYGFTPGELARQKKQLYSMYENAYNEREKTESSNLSNEYIRNFLTQEPIPGIEFEFDFVKKYLDGITLEEVNEISKQIITRENRVLIAMGPEKESLVIPGDDQLLAMISEVKSDELKPYEDKVKGNQLMTELPKKGRIMLTRKNEALGVTEMTLSNGAKVILKPTDFKNDEILFRAYSPGGYSLYSLDDFQSALNSSDIVGQSGVADYSPNDINKLLAGKKLSLNANIGPYFEGMSGNSAPKDLESMLQLMYLTFTAPRKDSALFLSYIAKQKGIIKNLLADPENYFFDQYTRIRTQNNPRAEVIPTEADIDRINFDRVFEIYKDRFSDASDFTFFFVGSFMTDSIKPLIETYLASLPATRRTETWKDMRIRPPEGKVDVPVYKGKDPKSIIAMYFEVSKPWDLLESHMYESLGELLDIRYTDLLREEMSGIYGMGVTVRLVKIPYEHLEASIYIPCSPENTDKLTRAALDEIARIGREGVGQDDLVKVKEAQRREYEKDVKENGYWIGQLVESYRLKDPSVITGYTDRMNAVSSDGLKDAAKAIDLNRYVRVVLYPEK